MSSIEQEMKQLRAELQTLRAENERLRAALIATRNLAENIMACNGYRCHDANGTENSVWLGPRLSNIIEAANAALAERGSK